VAGVGRLRNDLPHLRKGYVNPPRLTEEDRVVIAAMHKAGHTQKEIAPTIRFSRSTVSKALNRNRCEDGGYRTGRAQSRYMARKKRDAYKLRG